MKSRALLVMIFVSLWVAGLSARLHHLQVTEHDHYQLLASNQQQRVLDLEPPRGTIYDARGRVLAVSVEVESAFAVPREVEDAEGAARALAEVLDLDAARLEERLEQKLDFVFVARKLDPPLAAAVARLEIPGIHFLKESKRYYPMGELAASVLGFVGTDHKGLAGLEAQYDALVAGTPGSRTVMRDAHRQTLLSPRLALVEAEPGADLHLTLDATVQHIVERELAVAVEKYSAKSGTAAFLDPSTGEIVALAGYPTFDPNQFSRVSEAVWRNRAVQDSYEPGSTFKVITTAAVLEHRLLSPADLLYCEMGGITLAGQRIRDHHPFGELTVRQVLAKSSNVGVIKLSLLLGEDRLFKALQDFGFGRRTGIDLPGESAGIVRPLESWAALSKAYVSFGQEVSVTPLQMARALAVVANGGYLVTPHVVRSVMEAGGDRSIAPRVGDRVIDPVVAYELRSMLTGVVEEGTAKLARVEGYGVAGKTGTAQKVIDRRYSQTRFIASFMGMAPLENPRLVGIIVLDEPRPLYHGGQVAAPTFAAIARQVLPYWDLVPDRLAPTEPSFFESISEMQLVELESGPVPLPEEARFGVHDVGPATLGVSLGEGGR